MLFDFAFNLNLFIRNFVFILFVCFSFIFVLIVKMSESESFSDDEGDLFDNPFVMVCEEFIAEFERLLPHDVLRPHGRYEQTIQMVFDRIEALDHVRRISINGRYEFLLSERHALALFTRCVRQESGYFGIFLF